MVQRNFENVAQFRTGPCLPHLRNPGGLSLIHRPKLTATPDVEFGITSSKSRQTYQPLLPSPLHPFNYSPIFPPLPSSANITRNPTDSNFPRAFLPFVVRWNTGPLIGTQLPDN